VTGIFLFGIHGGLGCGWGSGLGIGAASPGWASAIRRGRPSSWRSRGRHTVLSDTPSLVDEEAFVAPEGPGALSLEVQETVALLDAELALLWREIAVKIDLAAAQRLALLQCSVLRGDTGEFHQDDPGSRRSPPHWAAPGAWPPGWAQACPRERPERAVTQPDE